MLLSQSNWNSSNIINQDISIHELKFLCLKTTIYLDRSALKTTRYLDRSAIKTTCIGSQQSEFTVIESGH